jgi:hypothetical protein
MTSLFAGNDAVMQPEGEERKVQDAAPSAPVSVPGFEPVFIPDVGAEVSPARSGEAPSDVHEPVPVVGPEPVAGMEETRPGKDVVPEGAPVGMAEEAPAPEPVPGAGGRASGGRKGVSSKARERSRERTAEKTVWIPAELHVILTRERFRLLSAGDSLPSSGSLLMEAYVFWLKKNARDVYDEYRSSGLIRK